MQSHFILDYVNGQRVIRDEARRSDHNPLGLTLNAIDAEIRLAKVLDQIDDRELLSFNMMASNPIMHTKESHAIPQSRGLALPELGELIQPTDRRAAEVIHKCPLIILDSARHQKALARWFYVKRMLPAELVWAENASNCAPTDADRTARVSALKALQEEADILLDVAAGQKAFQAGADGTSCEIVAIKKGRPAIAIDTKLLMQIDLDLRDYRDAVRECMSKLRDLTQVEEHFPRCAEIETVMEGECQRISTIAARGGTNLPGASVFSKRYLADRIGCTTKAVEKWLREARSE